MTSLEILPTRANRKPKTQRKKLLLSTVRTFFFLPFLRWHSYCRTDRQTGRLPDLQTGRQADKLPDVQTEAHRKRCALCFYLLLLLLFCLFVIQSVSRQCVCLFFVIAPLPVLVPVLVLGNGTSAITCNWY